jgi:two-component system sensor histidine kinase UhpB
MSSNVAQTLFRIVQEGLANIARHSVATLVMINMDRLEDGFSLTISDNGCGFDIDAVTGKGLGLQSMRERMQALDGSLDVVSTPGVGASLTARCQCAKEQVL